MNDKLYDMLKNKDFDDEKIKKIFELEEKMDIYQAEISTFLMQILATKELAYEEAETIQKLFRFADEYESISDYFTGILKRFLKLKEEDIVLDDNSLADIFEIHDKMTLFLQDVNKAVESCAYDADPKLIANSGMVKETFKEKRRSHLMRLSKQTVKPLLSVSYMDILTNYRKINDHLVNVIDVLAR
jgi:phosphate:Na+ symporter